jgi:hypothetical protein
MRWFPPKSMAEREAWANSHPWIAGMYFGLLFWAVFPLLTVLDTKRLRSAYLFGLVMWPVTAALIAVGLKRRWGVRVDAEPRPISFWSPWSNASTRFLSWFQWLGVAGIAASIGAFLGTTVRLWGTTISLLCACWIAGTTWLERRRRRHNS